MIQARGDREYGIGNRGQLTGNILIPIGCTNQQYSMYMAYLSIQMNIHSYFICIGNPRLHCLAKTIFRVFDINTYKSEFEKLSRTKTLRHGLESLRGAKINKKLETLKQKTVSYQTISYHRTAVQAMAIHVQKGRSQSNITNLT